MGRILRNKLRKFIENAENSEDIFVTFLGWSFAGAVIGMLVGLAGIAFHWALEWAAVFRTAHPAILWLLPFGGLLIVLAYRQEHMENDKGTNFILIAVRSNVAVSIRTAPLIFFSTVVTHLFGGSAGREGAALQLGGSIASWLGREVELNEREERIMTMCGMAAGFSALFGTPLTAVVFAMEVITVGVMHYSAIVPCTISALVAAGLNECRHYSTVLSCAGDSGRNYVECRLVRGAFGDRLRFAEHPVLRGDGAGFRQIQAVFPESAAAGVRGRLSGDCADVPCWHKGLQRRRHGTD